MSLIIVESLQAADDRITIAEYIARNTSVEMAHKFLHAVEAAYSDIADMPGIGSLRAYKNPRLSGLRMLPLRRFPNHLIFYLATDSSVDIVRVVHGARNLEDVFAPEVDAE